MAPHFSSELLEQLLGKQLEDCQWPLFDPELAEEGNVEIAIQVNGKLRGTLTINKGATQDQVEPQAKNVVGKWIENKKIIKIIFVPNRLINFVTK